MISFDTLVRELFSKKDPKEYEPDPVDDIYHDHCWTVIGCCALDVVETLFGVYGCVLIYFT